MKSVCKKNVRAALNRAYDRSMYEEVNDDWVARMRRFGRYFRAELFNETRKEYVIVTFTDQCDRRDNLDAGAELLLRRYESMYPDERKRDEVIAWENARDYLYFGDSKALWRENGHDMGLSKERGDEIWHRAWNRMAEED